MSEVSGAKRTEADRGSVVVEHIDHAKLLDRRVDPRLSGVRIAEVDRAGVDHCSPSICDQLQRLGIGCGVQVATDHGGALIGEQQRGSAALATGGAGDQGHAAIESIHNPHSVLN